MRGVLTVAAVVLLPLLSAAAPLPQDQPAGPPGLADRDGDGLSDDLQAKLAEARPGDRFDVIVTFSGSGDAASAQAAVGRFTVHRKFVLISGFSATMTAAQARALAGVPGLYRIEENLTVSTQPGRQ